MRRLVFIAQILLSLWLITLLFGIHFNTGLADNGDFTRAMTVFTSGPAGSLHNWPDYSYDHQAWEQRFFRYWIPYWKLASRAETNIFMMEYPSSAVLLWLPGITLNRIFFSTTVLYLPWISVLSRTLLVVVLFFIFDWVKSHRGNDTVPSLLLTLSLGIPYVLMVTTTDYAAYLNSFYYEPASLIFFLLLLVSLIALLRKRSFLNIAFFLLCAVLFTTAKVSNSFWPILLLPFVLYQPGKKRPSIVAVLGCSLLAVTLSYASYRLTQPPEDLRFRNEHNRFFDGLLTFSGDPIRHLKDMGIPECRQYVGISVYDPVMGDDWEAYKDKLAIGYYVRILVNEPAIVPRMIGFAADSMQKISLGYLGKNQIGSPTPQPSAGFNAWSIAKSSIFPIGYWYFGTLLCFGLLFFRTIHASGIRRELSTIGMLASVGVLIDMMVAIVGDGRHELVKHLFLSNVLFDVAAIAAVNILLASFIEDPRLFRRMADMMRPGRTPDTQSASHFNSQRKRP